MPMLPIPNQPSTRPLQGWLARPEGDGPWPGVLVIHEIFGLDDQTRMVADHIAGTGFLALAPDLYRGRNLRCIREVVTSMRSGHGAPYDDLEAARAMLADRDDCTGTVGVLGLCMGGSFALLLGTTGRYAAVSDNYGTLPPDISVLRESCPVVASYGGRDRSQVGAAARLEAALTDYDVPHDVKEYPTAGHSFLNERENAPLLVRPFTRAMIHAGPDPEAASDAWARIRAFFDEHLR